MTTSNPADAFTPLRRTLEAGERLVIGQLGQSLDGRIATVTGHSHYINGPAALQHLHALRAHVDAVVVGAGTICADDPQLTVRLASGTSPARVVLDPSGRVSPEARCWRDDGVPRLWIRQQGQEQGENAALPEGVEMLSLSSQPEGRIAPDGVLQALTQRGWRKILIEGGAWTVSHFLATGVLNRLHILMGPLIIGSGLPGLRLPEIDHLDHALRPEVTPHLLNGGDVLFDCDLSK
ncbi:MAG: RibD family protein, partial [Rhodospirillaceae bacterium]